MIDSRAERVRLRRQVLAARKALTPTQRRTASSRLARHFLALPEVAQARAIALYLSLPDEVDTAPVLEGLRKLDPPPLLAAPVVLPKRRMEMYPIPAEPAALHQSPFGIPEPPAEGEPLSPTDFAIIVVPGVAFDRSGYRLGYGAGYYDRYLSQLSFAHRPLLVGLAFSVQLVPAIPAAPHDVPVDLIVTEEGVQRFPRV
ncbi:MAG TPA: 5-formyltetrahydrofolate cyclo-ligase [Firmicutes bacterium]|nr:5-formyltetrahydrofolate cyclo-ligase [Bacillota bacterium]